MVKIALITAGAKRVGKSLVIYLANQGWDIVIHCNSSIDEAYLLKEELKNIAKIYIVQANFNNLSDVESIIPKINAEFGHVSLLINNSSAFINDNFDDFNIKNLQENLSVNLIAPSILIRDFYNQESFKTNNSLNGDIINILDYCVLTKPSNFYTYTISKMGLKNLIDLNVKLLAPKIKINGIILGPTIIGEKQKIQNFEASYNNSLLKKKTMLEDLHRTIDYIIHTPSITGDIISIDSGLRLTNFPYI
jgi:NAD(P)-dependent dehydrogenase (short-subunit alcohol dehydrogenase family)